MTYPTPIRKRSRRSRCQVTPGKFWLYGYPAGRDDLYPRKVMLTWEDGILSGDAELIADAQERANTSGRDMAHPLSIFSVLLGLFLVGVEVGGDIPTSDPHPSD